jgi:hypothetical protein
MRLEGSARARRSAKHLRKAMTPPEIALWLALRRNDAGLRFRKQYGQAIMYWTSIAHPQGWRSKSTARRILAMIGRPEMRSEISGSPRRAFKCCAIRRSK